MATSLSEAQKDYQGIIYCGTQRDTKDLFRRDAPRLKNLPVFLRQNLEKFIANEQNAIQNYIQIF